MVGTIFSDAPDGHKGVLKHWNMGWSVAKPGRPYYGKMDSDLCLRYFGNDVLPCYGQCDLKPLLFLDNWSVHKKFEEDFGTSKESQAEWMWKFMEDQDKSTAMYKEWRSIYIALGGSPSSERIKEFIKKHKVPVRRMEKLCSNYNVTLQFLAPYWSPTNPVEFVWARLKQIIRDQNPKLPIEERIEKAWRAIDHEFITACFDRSIRFCLAYEARLRGAGGIMAVGASGVKNMRKVYMGPLSPDSDEDNEGEDYASDSDDGASEDDEQEFKRFRA